MGCLARVNMLCSIASPYPPHTHHNHHTGTLWSRVAGIPGGSTLLQWRRAERPSSGAASSCPSQDSAGSCLSVCLSVCLHLLVCLFVCWTNYVTLYITKSISKFVTGLCNLLFIIILHMVMLDVLIHLRVKVTDREQCPQNEKRIIHTI